MSKITEIVNGWKNVVFKDAEIEKLAKKRALICDECPSASTGKNFDLYKGEVVELKGYCTECGCPFMAKLRSEETKCDLNKW